MPNRLELPDELDHLVEKREAARRDGATADESAEQTESDRRQAGRRVDDQVKEG